MSRKILHLDLDAFYCAVEELHNPALRERAFAVGGKPEERGVVASCSYPARLLGVRSAMPMRRALALCPHLIIVSSRHDLYSQVSQQVMERLHALTPLVEQISIDEAFLDASELPEDGESLARSLQRKIRDELGLPCSLGVASNKLVAKIANDFGKSAARKGSPPSAITIVPPGEEAAFLAPLAVQALWGVGPKTAERLGEMGIHTIGELAVFPTGELAQRFGKNGLQMSQYAQGIDDSPIITSHELKSISQETTFIHDVRDREMLRRTLHELSCGVGQRLRADGLCAATVKIKVRWSDFTTLTRQITLSLPSDQDVQIYAAALYLFEKVWKAGRAVRLLGVGVSKLGMVGDIPHQLQLFES